MKEAARAKRVGASWIVSSGLADGGAVASVKRVPSRILMTSSVLLVALACNPTAAPKEAHDAKSDPSASPASTAPAPVASASVDASASAAVACGAVTCKAGEICCNASCGICTPPDGMCTQQFCAPDAGQGAPSSSSSSAPAPRGPAACASDADCKTWSSYCDKTPCLCLALGASEAAPKCTGSRVACLVDPCQGKTAACRAGRCTIAQAPTK